MVRRTGGNERSALFPFENGNAGEGSDEEIAVFGEEGAVGPAQGPLTALQQDPTAAAAGHTEPG